MSVAYDTSATSLALGFGGANTFTALSGGSQIQDCTLTPSASANMLVFFCIWYGYSSAPTSISIQGGNQGSPSAMTQVGSLATVSSPALTMGCWQNGSPVNSTCQAFGTWTNASNFQCWMTSWIVSPGYSSIHFYNAGGSGLITGTTSPSLTVSTKGSSDSVAGMLYNDSRDISSVSPTQAALNSQGTAVAYGTGASSVTLTGTLGSSSDNNLWFGVDLSTVAPVVAPSGDAGSLQLLLGDSIGWTPSLLGRPLPLLGAAAASGAARLIRSGAKVSRRLLVTGRDR